MNKTFLVRTHLRFALIFLGTNIFGTKLLSHIYRQRSLQSHHMVTYRQGFWGYTEIWTALYPLMPNTLYSRDMSAVPHTR